MTLPLQPSGQKVSVRCIVIYDQNPTGSHCRKACFIRGYRTYRLEQALNDCRRRGKGGGAASNSIPYRSIATRICDQAINSVEEQGCFYQELVEIGDERFRAPL